MLSSACRQLYIRNCGTKLAQLSLISQHQQPLSSSESQAEALFTQRRHLRRENSVKNKVAPGRQLKHPNLVQPIDMQGIFSDKEPTSSEPDSTEMNEERETEHEDFIIPRMIGNSTILSAFQSELSTQDLDFQHSEEDWRCFREKALAENPALHKSWETLCMMLMYHFGRTDLAESLLNFVRRESQSPKLTTLSMYVALQGRYGGDNKDKIVQETYRDILEISDVFDAVTAKYLIAGLSLTSEWQTSIDILEMVKLTTLPGPVYYSPIIAAAIRNCDTELAFKLLDEMALHGFEPKKTILMSILQECEQSSSHHLLEKYFACVWKYCWVFTPDMAEEIQRYFARSVVEKWSGKWTNVNTVRGVCHGCKQGLDRIELGTSDFEAMQREFLERALVGTNVYLQSNPEEVERFQDFVMENAPFDVVLDALNVAYRGSGRPLMGRAKQLREIVHFFARERHMRVLVIGRAHMKKWPAADMNYICRYAKTFFTEDISSDDPFCLYATLYSGKDCLFVSGDFMRNHKYKLGPRFKETFERWQKSRQIFNFTVEEGRVSVMMPSQFDCGPVNDDKGWHIPYSSGTTDLRSSSQPVLCLRYKGRRRTSQRADTFVK